MADKCGSEQTLCFVCGISGCDSFLILLTFWRWYTTHGYQHGNRQETHDSVRRYQLLRGANRNEACPGKAAFRRSREPGNFRGKIKRRVRVAGLWKISSFRAEGT